MAKIGKWMLLALPVCNTASAWNTCVGGFNVLHIYERYMNIGCYETVSGSDMFAHRGTWEGVFLTHIFARFDTHLQMNLIFHCIF